MHTRTAAVPNLAAMRKLNRERVLDFEAEIREKLQILVVIEKQIQETGVQRKAWLSSISDTYQTESEVHNRMIEVVKAECDLTSLRLKLDLLKLESQYEEQKLSVLIEATRPLEDDETAEERDVALKVKARQNSDLLCAALEASLETRLKLMDHTHELSCTVVKVKAQAQAELHAQAEDVKAKLESYKTRMQASAQKSQAIYSRILREYLILRHNAHVAEEILQRSQSDAAQARAELQRCLERLLAEAERQKQRVVASAEKELTLQTADLRAEVMRRENELEEVSARVSHLQHQRKNDLKDLRSEVRRYNDSYRALQLKRRQDLVVVNQELHVLKDIISDRQRALNEAAWSPAQENEAAEGLAQLRQMFDRLQLKSHRPCQRQV